MDNIRIGYCYARIIGNGAYAYFRPLTQGERTHGHSGVLINSTVDGGMVFRDYLIQMKQEVLRNSYSHTIEAQKKLNSSSVPERTGPSATSAVMTQFMEQRKKTFSRGMKYRYLFRKSMTALH